MAGFRALIRRNGSFALALAVLALLVKALVPAGFMIAPQGDRFLTVTICADASGTPRQMTIALPGKNGGSADHSDTAGQDRPCAFAGLGHPALGSADPVLLAAALAFILLVGLAPLRALAARDIPFLRPPLRGPPALFRLIAGRRAPGF